MSNNHSYIDISIIYVNYHSESEIFNSIKSYLEGARKLYRIEIIIISNSYMSEKEKSSFYNTFPSTVIELMPKNMGFATACNKGADIAKGEHLFFLNPDTLLTSDNLNCIYKNYINNDQIGLIGPKILDENNQLTGSIKNKISFLNLLHNAIPILGFFIPTRFHSGQLKSTNTKQVDVVSGCAMFLSAQLFESVGGMNERFFLYWEENDLCLKIARHGYRILYLNECEIIHIGGTSTSKYFYAMEVQKHKSQRLFMIEHHKQLVGVNRFLGIFAYLWRTLFSIPLLKLDKTKQFYTIFNWYLFRYR